MLIGRLLTVAKIDFHPQREQRWKRVVSATLVSVMCSHFATSPSSHTTHSSVLPQRRLRQGGRTDPSHLALKRAKNRQRCRPKTAQGVEVRDRRRIQQGTSSHRCRRLNVPLRRLIGAVIVVVLVGLPIGGLLASGPASAATSSGFSGRQGLSAIPASSAWAGAHWSQTLSARRVGQLDAVHFVNAHDGFVSGPGLLFGTGDGGATWQVQRIPAGVGTLDAIACVSATMCVAGGWNQTGGAMVIFGTFGHQWQSGSLPAGITQVYRLTCVAESCVATGAEGDGTPALITSGDGARTWTLAALPTGIQSLDTVACSAVGATCVAGGELSQQAETSSGPYNLGVVLASQDGGSTWSTGSLPPQSGEVLSVDCPAPSSCVAADGDSLLRSSDNGQTWAVVSAISQPCAQCVGVVWADVAFANPGMGVAVGHGQCGGYQFAADAGISCGGAVAVTADGGQTWKVAAEAQALVAVSCPDAAHCWALESTNSSAGVLATADGGTSWSAQPIDGINALGLLVCASPDVCIAAGADNSGNPLVLRTTDAGTTWARVSLPGGGGYFYGLACPTSSKCLAVVTPDEPTVGPDRAHESAGYVIASTDAGAHWVRRNLPLDDSEAYGVACSSTTACVATGGGHVAVTTDGGATWAPSKGGSIGSLLSVTCPSTSRCVAGGYGASVAYWSSDGGRTWSPATVNGLPSPGPANSGLVLIVSLVSCPSANECVGIGTEGATGAPDQSSPVRFVISTSDGGTTWKASRLPSQVAEIGSLWCTSASSCLLSGGTATGPAVWLVHGDGSVTKVSTPPGPAYSFVTSFACPTATHCLAAVDVDNEIALETAALPGSSGQAPIRPAGTSQTPSKQSTLASTLVPVRKAFPLNRHTLLNALITVLAMILITFPAQLFNRTLDENY